jgi:DNA-binding MarR family transcriptional regulator
MERLLLTENPRLTCIPEDLMRAGAALSHGVFRLWCAIQYHIGIPGAKVNFPAQEKLAEMLGISTQQVRAFMKELRKADLVVIEKKEKDNGLGFRYDYTMKDVGKWWKEKGEKMAVERMAAKRKKYIICQPSTLTSEV